MHYFVVVALAALMWEEVTRKRMSAKLGATCLVLFSVSIGLIVNGVQYKRRLWIVIGKILNRASGSAFAGFLLSAVMSGAAISSDSYVTEEEWSGIDGYLVNMESKTSDDTVTTYERSVNRGESGNRSPNETDLSSSKVRGKKSKKDQDLESPAVATDGATALRSLDCSRAWMSTSGNNLRYDGYISSISIKIKLTISTLTFSGGSTPDSCYRRWLYMEYINNKGQVFDRENRRVINANKTKYNEAYYRTEHNYYAVGSVVSKPSYARTTHEAKYKNSGNKFIVRRTINF